MRVDKVTSWRNNVPQCQDLGKALARRTEANDHMHPTQVLLSYEKQDSLKHDPY